MTLRTAEQLTRHWNDHPRWSGVRRGYTAEDVVRAAGELKPDVVFMDITLKGVLDGITAAVAIRGRTGAPVVFLTAHADEKTMKRSVFAGPFEYILKPFTRKELQSAVQASLQKRQAELEDRAVLQR